MMLGDGETAQHQGTAEDLQRTETENQPAQMQKPLEAQFEADHEQQKDDAEFRRRGDLVEIAKRDTAEPARHAAKRDERAQTIRPENGTGGQIAEDRADLQPP